MAVNVNTHRCLTQTTAAVTVRAMNLGQRVVAARSHKGLTQADLAKRIGMSQQSVAKLEAGGAKRTSRLAEICLETEVSLRWLARGEGEMLESQPERPDRDILAHAIEALTYLAQMQAGAADFLTDADAILAAYDFVSREPSQAFDLEGASRRMAAWLRGRKENDGMERSEFVGAG